MNINKVLLALSLTSVLTVNANESIMSTMSNMATKTINTGVDMIQDINTTKVKNFVEEKIDASKAYTKSLKDSNNTLNMKESTSNTINSLKSYFRGDDENSSILSKTKLLRKDLINVSKEKYNELVK